MFTVLRSSAGAGKTHALVKEYLRHCLDTDRTDSYRQVLALTFTTKAAGEMRERVLSYLRHLSAGQGGGTALEDVRQVLLDRTGMSGEELQERARAVFSHMLHHWSDVSIGTIDAFTRRLLRPFARDLRLDHDLEMSTEVAELLDRAVFSLLNEAGTSPAMTRLLTRTALRMVEDGSRWRPDGPLRLLANELLMERSVRPLSELSTLSLEEVLEAEGAIKAAIDGFRQRLQELGRRGSTLLKEAGLDASDLYQGARGLPTFLGMLSSYEGRYVPPNSYVQRMLDGEKWHSGKASTEVQERSEAVRPFLVSYCLEALALIEEGHQDDLLRRAVLKDLMPTAALHELNVHLERGKADEGVVFFSDLTRSAARLVRTEPVPFIHERMGERYQHFLLDEFQDTSLMQWQGLLPLVDHALASGGSVFLVGDGKQAIYRWRNGEVRQFLDLPRIFAPEGLADAPAVERTLIREFKPREPLHANYRSGSAIIRFNNDLFAGLAGSMLPPELQTVYAGHEQSASRQEEGSVRVDRLPERSPDTDSTSERADRIVGYVQEMIAQGHAPGDIAILVRTSAQGKDVANWLMNAGIGVVSSDALQLGGDPTTEFVVDLLRCLQGPDQPAATRALQQWARLMATEEGVAVDPFGTDERDPLVRIQEIIGSMGLKDHQAAPADLILRILSAMNIDPGADAYALTLLDEAHAHAVGHGADLSGFIAHWDRSGAGRGVVPPEHGQAVRIMTIHRSKGLQFPVVIVPFPEVGRASGKDLLWVTPGETVPGLPAALVRMRKDLAEVGVPEAVEEQHLRALDDLDLLYVAFTRAEDALYVVLDNGRSGLSAAIAGLLGPWEDDRYSLGSLPPVKRAAPGPTGRAWPAMRSREWDATPHFRTEAPPGWSAHSPDPFRSHGTMVHELLAEVRTPEDLDRVLELATRRRTLSVEMAAQLHEQLSPQLSGPDLARFFGNDLEVRTEASIIHPDGGVLRPDRIVRKDDRIRLLDIKTGDVRGDHQDQMRSYMDVLRSTGETVELGALWYVRTGEVHLVEPMA